MQVGGQERRVRGENRAQQAGVRCCKYATATDAATMMYILFIGNRSLGRACCKYAAATRAATMLLQACCTIPSHLHRLIASDLLLQLELQLQTTPASHPLALTRASSSHNTTNVVDESTPECHIHVISRIPLNDIYTFTITHILHM